MNSESTEFSMTQFTHIHEILLTLKIDRNKMQFGVWLLNTMTSELRNYERDKIGGFEGNHSPSKFSMVCNIERSHEDETYTMLTLFVWD